MNRRLFVCATFASLGLCGLASAAAPAGKKSASIRDAANDVVDKVLRAELQGPVDRRAALQGPSQELPASQVARWQAGFVRDGDAWQSADQPASLTNTEAWKRYRIERQQAPQTAAGQLELANWCRKHELPDQERAHLTTALALVPAGDDSPVRERLGYRRISNQWLSPEQIAQWRSQNARALASLKKWGPQLEKLADQLQGPERKREVGQAAVKRLSDPDVIPALEYEWCGRDEALATTAVDVFGRLPGYEAAQALARQAVFSKWPTVRNQATGQLKSRRLEDFVPDLIGLLVRPAGGATTSEWRMFHEPMAQAGIPFGFALVYQSIVAWETNDQFQVASLTTVDYRLNELMRGAHVLKAQQRVDYTDTELFHRSPVLALQSTDRERSFADRSYERERSVSDINDRVDDLNRRVAGVLTGVTSHEPNSDPSTWWKWWADYTDTERIGSKPVVEVAEEYDQRGDPTARLYYRPCSCFAAGTPVWTERGALAIEKIQVGDRVLSQDIKSGELAFKPVLSTTIRPSRPLMRLEIGGETIVCTGGHRFWVPGEGWTKSRDLTPLTLLHTVTGTQTVSSAKKAPTQPTYNLLVADAHDYFVGTAGLLVQDLPLPTPTNTLVPGLASK